MSVREQHTPGPWRSSKTAEVTAEAGRYICCVGDQDRHGDAIDLCNARLIAAAPDMKAALGHAFDFLSKVKDGSFDPRDIDGLQHTMLAALDKTSPDEEVAF